MKSVGASLRATAVGAKIPAFGRHFQMRGGIWRFSQRSGAHHRWPSTSMWGAATAWLHGAHGVIAFVVGALALLYGLGWVAFAGNPLSGFARHVFMMGAAYTLLHDGHVRVDVFLCAPPALRTKAMIQSLRILFPA